MPTLRAGDLVYDRVSSVHQETSLCVACHATHFPLRRCTPRGTAIPWCSDSSFSSDPQRFQSNPRPFSTASSRTARCGPESSRRRRTSWAACRICWISTSARFPVNGGRPSTRASAITSSCTTRVARKLPPDETNCNTPLVSRYEVAWYAWSNTHDGRMGDLIASGEIENMVDLCYQTQALAEFHPQRYRGQIRKNAERILSLQRPNGQWSMRFGPEQPEVEFQTGHALWALQAAGVPASNPGGESHRRPVLCRQQTFGGWMDPLQSFENFRTPFRETQMVVLALSSYFRSGWRARRGAAAPARLSSDPVELLQQLDGIWDPVTDGMRAQIRRALVSPDALIRKPREALGRLGGQDAALLQLLGDPSKMAQADPRRMGRAPVIQSASGDFVSRLTAVLESKDDRTDWGATRVFAQHFAAIATRPEFGAVLAKRVADPVTSVRMQAVKGLWQFWQLDHGHGDEGADPRRLCSPRWHSRNRPGGEQSGGRGLQSRRREHPRSGTTTGWRCCPRPRIAIGQFEDGWPWNRGWRRNSPRSWKVRQRRRRRGCCGRSPSFRYGAATSTIPRPI